MPKVTQSDRNLFEQLCRAREQGVLSVMSNGVLKRNGYTNVIRTPNYVMAEGQVPVVLIAHADTVFTTPPKMFFYDQEQNVSWSPDGMGADDRAGIFAITKLIRAYGLRPHVIITTGEESGCIGASKLIGKYRDFPWEAKFLIQLDRRGEKDSVYYDCDNPEFEDFITPFGFVTDWGSLSDISVLAPAWGIAAVNLSVGYRDEHTHIERLHWDDLYATIDKVAEIIKYVDEHRDMPEYIYIEAPTYRYGKYSYAWRYPQEWDDEYEYDLYHHPSSEWKCWMCQKKVQPDEVVSLFVEGQRPEKKYVCCDCFAKISSNVDLCTKCGKAWLMKNPAKVKKEWVCPHCVEEALVNGYAVQHGGTQGAGSSSNNIQSGNPAPTSTASAGQMAGSKKEIH